jgi:hypothetical protein
MHEFLLALVELCVDIHHAWTSRERYARNL